MGKPNYAGTCHNNCVYLAELEARIKGLRTALLEAITFVSTMGYQCYRTKPWREAILDSEKQEGG